VSRKVISMQRENFFLSQSEAQSESLFVRYYTSTLPGFSGGPVLIWDGARVLVAAVHQHGVPLIKSSQKAEYAAVIAADKVLQQDLNDQKMNGFNEGCKVTAVLAFLQTAHKTVYDAIRAAQRATEERQT
jgi:hypothetical protein